MIDPALKGTLNVLRSCVKAPSLKRVVFTSSSRAVFANGRPVTPDVIVDETWVSDIAFCEKTKVRFAILFYSYNLFPSCPIFFNWTAMPSFLSTALMRFISYM